MYLLLLCRFSSDADINSKLKLNVDLTVAMPCDSEYLVHFFYTYTSLLGRYLPTFIRN